MRLVCPDLDAESIRPLVERIRVERGEVLDLYALLLHSPPIADGWLALLTAVRQRSSLPGAIRELVIMRVGYLNGASYEAEQHRPFALQEGLTASQIDALIDWRSSDTFDLDQRAVLAFTDAMTRDIRVASPVFDAVRAQFDDAALVELAVTIGAYNMVSRVLEVFHIHAAHDGREASDAAA